MSRLQTPGQTRCSVCFHSDGARTTQLNRFPGFLNAFGIALVLLLVLSAGCRSKQPPAAGLWDEGFRIGTVRTDYESRDEGTVANRLTLVPCLYPKRDDALLGPAGASAVGTSPCAMAPNQFQQSNPFTNAGDWPEGNFWVLSVNNEFAYDNVRNSGPPNQSLPVASPGEGLMGLQVAGLAGDARQRIVLALDQRLAEPGRIGIPFLGIGADVRRGNGRPIGYLNRSGPNPKIQFKIKLLDADIPDQPGSAGVVWFYAYSFWGGKPRMVMVALYHEGMRGDALPFDHDTGGRSFRHAHWNWNIRESFFFPGADLVFMDIEDIAVLGTGSLPRLTQAGQEQTYAIDLQEIFELARDGADRVGLDEPLPETADLPILGVHWAVEVAGEATRLSISLEAMQTVE